MNKLLLTLAVLTSSCADAEPLGKLNIDAERITVSGISAGGQMAHQMHIAYSDLFNGAAIIAGGPFGCANGSLATAMGNCMGTFDGSYLAKEQADAIRSAAEAGLLAATEALANDPVWLFHGTQDTTVAAGLSDAVMALYSEFIPAERLVYVNDVESWHNFPAKGRGSDCSVMQVPFVADCDYDAAGELLQHLYQDLKTPLSEPEIVLGEVQLPGAAAVGMNETAYLFTPSVCMDGEQSCALHLVLHGCAQSAVKVGTNFIRQSGYLPWAAANGIVLAFPQVEPAPMNPYACWDWWGYTGEQYRYRDGAQMKLLADWVIELKNGQGNNDEN